MRKLRYHLALLIMMGAWLLQPLVWVLRLLRQRGEIIGVAGGNDFSLALSTDSEGPVPDLEARSPVWMRTCLPLSLPQGIGC